MLINEVITRIEAVIQGRTQVGVGGGMTPLRGFKGGIQPPPSSTPPYPPLPLIKLEFPILND